MKKASKNKKKKKNTYRVATLLILVVLFGIVMVVLPTTQTKRNSLGATIPFTPVPAKSNLQLETFTLPTSPSPAQQKQPVKPTTQPAKQQPGNSFQPINSSPVKIPAPAHPIISPFKSNGQLCSVANNSGQQASGNCYCPDLQVTCKNGVGYGANGAPYPGVNPCGSKEAPKSGRYCVEKPVIYLYPTTPTLVDVQVLTSGSVVVSDPHYPADGWKHILAHPDGSLEYEGKSYTELFYESSVYTFQKPQNGITIPTNKLAERLPFLLDQLGLVGNEKQEFLSFWLPRLNALHSPYIFFSILNQSAKANIDSVSISPKPDTQIAFIAYFKPVSQPSSETLQLNQTPKRQGFVSVEWGGVIDK